MRAYAVGALKSLDDAAGGIQIGGFLSKRCRFSCGDMCLCIAVAVLFGPEPEEYRVATLTVREHTASNTIAPHQRWQREFFRFVSRIT